MRRRRCHPRDDWQHRLEDIGFTYHSHDHGPYWDESVFYELTAAEVDTLETAANTLHQLCIEAADAVIRHQWWSRLRIPPGAIPAILRSWERDDFSLYGRFDVAYDGQQPPKLLEYNADTPTALLEASVAQWFWQQDLVPGADQFNSIHERLLEAWRRWAGTTLHFSGVRDHPEDEQTVLYLRDTCQQAGVVTAPVFMDDIGWDPARNCFVDLNLNPIRRCFKLYPWEWLWEEEFAVHLDRDTVQFIEPAWKMLLSNKGLLPILWEMFPDHPNLLPAFETANPLHGHYIQKPLLGREGSNVTRVEYGSVVEASEGDYGEEGFIYQALAPVPDLDGHYPVFGIWMIDHEAAGLGIREDTRRITGNLSRFVPHCFR
jgi:glutathionylspermidine synthase